ncbi:hypothetical protein AB205_0155400 [Aquarana catesbeiana]|uniref:Uncharacterized protein n=1 Tax=Aquarana catesbeiana TaxID=8400 RepID=A0A2G9NBT9_AQUCT|nr:hypothetical protein AB205_0155400 [Aquarana catesbeiana]
MQSIGHKLMNNNLFWPLECIYTQMLDTSNVYMYVGTFHVFLRNLVQLCIETNRLPGLFIFVKA